MAKTGKNGNKLHPHAALIDPFGPTAVAKAMNERKKNNERSLTSQAVSRWRKKGISVWFRFRFADFLIAQGRRVPKGFLDTGHRYAAE